MHESYLLAIPVYNEQEYVDRVLRESAKYADNILVVDDGSTDETAQRLCDHPSIHVISHPENRGYGQSLASAFSFAQRNEFSWLITMDCDEQHEPSQIPRFLAEMAKDQADIISGTRYPDGHDVGGVAPSDRREINRQITAMLNQSLGLTLTDSFCGFKAYRVSCLRHFRITVPGYAMPMQFWVQAARAELRIRELSVPLIYNDFSRHFGGVLDDPEVRLAHYKSVFESELCAEVASGRTSTASCLPCR